MGFTLLPADAVLDRTDLNALATTGAGIGDKCLGYLFPVILYRLGRTDIGADAAVDTLLVIPYRQVIHQGDRLGRTPLGAKPAGDTADGAEPPHHLSYIVGTAADGNPGGYGFEDDDVLGAGSNALPAGGALVLASNIQAATQSPNPSQP